MYKKQRPLTATFPATRVKPSDICTSEMPAQKQQRPKTALSRHIVNELDSRFGSKDNIPLKKYERLNDPKMDPVVVKAVRSFAKQKKIVTHETIIDIGERVARAKEHKHQQELEIAVQKAVEEEREVLKREFKVQLEREQEDLTSTWIEKIDNTDQIAEAAAQAAAKRVREEMEEKIARLEQVHVKLTEGAVQEALQREKKEWKILEKQHLRQARIEWEAEFQRKLNIKLTEELEQKQEHWKEEEKKRILELTEELGAVFQGQVEEAKRRHSGEITQLNVCISGLESQVAELECQVIDEQEEHHKTQSVLQDTRFHFSRFIGEVPGFQSDYFTSSPFPDQSRDQSRDHS